MISLRFENQREFLLIQLIMNLSYAFLFIILAESGWWPIRYAIQVLLFQVKIFLDLWFLSFIFHRWRWNIDYAVTKLRWSESMKRIHTGWRMWDHICRIWPGLRSNPSPAWEETIRWFPAQSHILTPPAELAHSGWSESSPRIVNANCSHSTECLVSSGQHLFTHVGVLEWLDWQCQHAGPCCTRGRHPALNRGHLRLTDLPTNLLGVLTT